MIELELLKTQIKHTLPESDPTEDELLEQYERGAVAHVQRRTGRYYGPPVDDAEFVTYGDGTSMLYLPERMSGVATVTERLYQGDAGTSILTGADDGWVLRIPAGLSYSNRLVRKGGSVWYPSYEYVVTGTIGYNAGEEPYNVRQAVLYLAAHWYVNRIPVALGTVAPEIAHTLDELLKLETRIPV